MTVMNSNIIAINVDQLPLELATLVPSVLGITRFRVVPADEPLESYEQACARLVSDQRPEHLVVMDPREQSRDLRSPGQVADALVRVRNAWHRYQIVLDEAEARAERARLDLERAQEQLRIAQHTIAGANQVLENGARERTRASVDLRLALDDIALFGHEGG